MLMCMLVCLCMCRGKEVPRASKGLAEFSGGPSHSTPPHYDEIHYDATDDIQDIDRRLNALQHFIEAAKTPH